MVWSQRLTAERSYGTLYYCLAPTHSATKNRSPIASSGFRRKPQRKIACAATWSPVSLRENPKPWRQRWKGRFSIKPHGRVPSNSTRSAFRPSLSTLGWRATQTPWSSLTVRGAYPVTGITSCASVPGGAVRTQPYHPMTIRKNCHPSEDSPSAPIMRKNQPHLPEFSTPCCRRRSALRRLSPRRPGSGEPSMQAPADVDFDQAGTSLPTGGPRKGVQNRVDEQRDGSTLSNCEVVKGVFIFPSDGYRLGVGHDDNSSTRHPGWIILPGAHGQGA